MRGSDEGEFFDLQSFGDLDDAFLNRSGILDRRRIEGSDRKCSP